MKLPNSQILNKVSIRIKYTFMCLYLCVSAYVPSSHWHMMHWIHTDHTSGSCYLQSTLYHITFSVSSQFSGGLPQDVSKITCHHPNNSMSLLHKSETGSPDCHVMMYSIHQCMYTELGLWIKGKDQTDSLAGKAIVASGPHLKSSETSAGELETLPVWKWSQ